MRRLPPTLALLLAGLLPACDTGLPAGRTPHRELNFLDMADQPRLKPQRPDLFGGWPTGMLAPPAGSIAVDEHPYVLAQAQGDEAGRLLTNPLPDTPEVLDHGQFVFEHVCITCHGPQAAGDGVLTRVFPHPPSLLTRRVRDWRDGSIFHRPMRGQGAMPSHARQLSQDDIWAVVRYLRKLQSELPVAPAGVAAAAGGALAATREGRRP